MTKPMLDDMVEFLQRRLKRTQIALVVLAIICVALFCLLFAEFTIESCTEIEQTIEEAETDGAVSVININDSNFNGKTVIICTCILSVSAIITGGLVAYGKSEGKSKTN